MVYSDASCCDARWWARWAAAKPVPAPTPALPRRSPPPLTARPCPCLCAPRCCRFERKKGIGLALQALHELGERRPSCNARLIVAGACVCAAAAATPKVAHTGGVHICSRAFEQLRARLGPKALHAAAAVAATQWCRPKAGPAARQAAAAPPLHPEPV